MIKNIYSQNNFSRNRETITTNLPGQFAAAVIKLET